MQLGDRPNKALCRLVQACVLGMGLWPVQASLADDAAETCFPIYRKGKAIPRTKDCEAKAATAPTELSNYFCVASPQLIQRFCDAQCEVDPLTPITDPDALGFEDGSNRVREDKLSESMSTKLNCLRDAVSSAQGALTVTSAWRPQSYQDHLREIADKFKKLRELVEHDHVDECRPAPCLDAIREHRGSHGPGSEVGRTSLHTTGEAFDAVWSRVTDSTVDSLASGCQLMRPYPSSFADGGDPVHFQHKSRLLDLKHLLSIPGLLAVTSGLAEPYTPPQLGLTITADGVHERQNDGTFRAIYSFTITNHKAPQVRGITLGSDSLTAPPVLNDERFAINRDWVAAPAGWTAEVTVQEESTRKEIYWGPADPDDWNLGIRPGQSVTFSLQAHQAVPALLKTRMLIGLRSFKYLGPPVVELTPADTTAPTLTTQLDVAPAPDRPGWLKVSAGHAVLDNHDPYPQTVLSRIDSNQPITGKDIDAAIGTPAPVFYLKQAKGRTYTVSYQAMDASGNATTSRSLVNASR